jgi:mono/diheme cytochrome c family protein
MTSLSYQCQPEFVTLGAGRFLITAIPHGEPLMLRSASLAFALIATLFASADANAQSGLIARGKYLANFGGCNDCHTPGYFFGKPDMDRYLGGSEVGFEIPGLGVFHGPNLTPDKETGLGNWTRDQIITALKTGTRPDRRILAPIMPWRALTTMSNRDLRALVAYLQSLKPVTNKVPGPFGPQQTPTSFVMKIVPPPGGAPPQ